MFPIKDHNPSGKLPIVTYALIGLNALIFLYTFFVVGPDLGAQEVFFEQWALKPSEVLEGTELHTLITSVFLHGGWMHLIGNMLFLNVFGDNLESRLGHVRYLLYYLLCGVAASWLQIAFTTDTSIFNIGASGAVAGVLGGYIVLYPHAKVDVMLMLFIIMRRIVMPAWVVLGLWLAYNVVSGVMDLNGAGEGGIAFWAHVGGFIAGAVLAVPLKLINRTRNTPDHDSDSAIF